MSFSVFTEHSTINKLIVCLFAATSVNSAVAINLPYRIFSK